MNPFTPHIPFLALLRSLIKFSLKAIFAAFILIQTFSSKAQKITIGAGGQLVLNGSVALVINNAAFENNGQFSAGGSTVSFSGNHDTLKSFVSGSSASTFNNLSINKSAHGVALKSPVIVGSVLSVTGGNLYTDSNLTLKSAASLTARLDPVATGSQIIGKANVQRYMGAIRAWRLLTAPVTGSQSIFNSWQNNGLFNPGKGMFITGPAASGAAGNGLDVSAQNAVSMKSFNYSTGQFVNVTNTKVPISAGLNGSADNTGYFVFVRGDRDPNNTSVSYVNATVLTSIGNLQTGNQEFTASPVAGKYTLIGNPYASPVDFNNVTRTNILKRFYVWDPTLNSVGGYVMLDDLNNDGIFAKTIAGSSQTKEIQSGQAFFVETINSSPASLTFLETSKSTGSSNLIFRPETPSGQPTGQLSATLYLFDPAGKNKLADGVLAEFDDSYAAGINREDALKFSNTNENLMIIRNNVSLAAERRPALTFSDTIFLRISNITQREYQFVFDAIGLNQPGMTGYLEDSFLGTSKLLNLSGSTVTNFNISSQAGSAAPNRFRIVFKLGMIVLPVTLTSFSAYEKNRNIAVEWKVENEINMVKYDVEKSTSGSAFAKVFTVQVVGNNNARNSYQWTDVNPAAGNNYFRIRNFDRSGNSSYSTIEKVMLNHPNKGIAIFPNPAKGNIINLRMSDQPSGIYQVQIFNEAGQQVHTGSFRYSGGITNQKIESHSPLPAGIYHLKTTLPGNDTVSQQLIVR